MNIYIQNAIVLTLFFFSITVKGQNDSLTINKIYLRSNAASVGLKIQEGVDSPNSGFLRFGDNTGWKLHFGRRKESVSSSQNNGTNGVLMTIQDNGNVGIGTTSPLKKLSVRDTAPTLLLETISGSEAYSTEITSNYDSEERFYIKNGITKNFGNKKIANNATQTYLNDYYGLSFLTGVVDPVASNVRMFINQNGKVGIGTTTPTSLLDVNGETQTKSFKINGTSGNSALANFALDGTINAYQGLIGQANTIINGSSAGDYAIRTQSKPILISLDGGTSTHLKFNTNGNLGIGNSNPNYKLDVNGPINVPENISINVGTLNGITNSFFGYSGTYRAIKIGGSGAISLGVDLMSNLSSQFRGNEIVIPNNKAIIAPNDANNDYVGILRYNGEKMFLGGSNYQTLGHLVINTTNGNVGIGNNNPQTKLEVTSTVNEVSLFKGTAGIAAVRVNNDINKGLTLFTYKSDYVGGSVFGVGANGAGLIQEANAPFSIGTYGVAQPMIFGTNSSEKMRIDANGNVGIGITNPKVKFQVSGDTRIVGNLNVGDSLSNWIPFNVNQKTPYIYTAKFAHSGTTEDRQLTIGYKDGGMGIWASTFSGGNNSNLFFNSGGGNVGIGTSTPQYALHVIGGTYNNEIVRFVTKDNLSHSVGLGVDASGNNWGSSIFQDGIKRFTIDSNSGILVGTTFQNLNAPDNGALIEGNVAIGTLPYLDYKLSVAGNVIADKVKVKKSTNGIWPDFVFAPTYKLPTLAEVEHFVKQNSHLPEIPSAIEIEKEGQDLGEMNRLLLKKVEELTLYMIEQNKKMENVLKANDEQNKEIEILKSKVEQLEKK